MRVYSKLCLGLVAFALVVGCKNRDTNPDPNAGGDGSNSGVSSTPVGGTDLTAGGASEPMKFDASGSDSGSIAGLETIHFDYDKSAISAEAKKKIQGNVAWMKSNPKVTVQIEGHCDARGSIEYNVALGERRANAVKAYMASLGISTARLKTISFGKDKPLVSGDSEEAYSKNRRANFNPLQ